MLPRSRNTDPESGSPLSIHLPICSFLCRLPSSSELSAFQSLGHGFIPAQSPFDFFIKIVTFSIPSPSGDLLRKWFSSLWENDLCRIEEKGAVSHPSPPPPPPQGERSSCCSHYNFSLEALSQPATLKIPLSSGFECRKNSRPNLLLCILRQNLPSCLRKTQFKNTPSI